MSPLFSKKNSKNSSRKIEYYDSELDRSNKDLPPSRITLAIQEMEKQRAIARREAQFPKDHKRFLEKGGPLLSLNILLELQKQMSTLVKQVEFLHRELEDLQGVNEEIRGQLYMQNKDMNHNVQSTERQPEISYMQMPPAIERQTDDSKQSNAQRESNDRPFNIKTALKREVDQFGEDKNHHPQSTKKIKWTDEVMKSTTKRSEGRST